MVVPPFAGETMRPQRGIDLDDGGAPDRNVPAVERPEMPALTEALTHVAQPRNSGMGRFRHRSRRVEMKHRLRPARALLGQTPPPAISRARHYCHTRPRERNR